MLSGLPSKNNLSIIDKAPFAHYPSFKNDGTPHYQMLLILSKTKTFGKKYFKKNSAFVIRNLFFVISLIKQHIKYATDKSNKLPFLIRHNKQLNRWHLKLIFFTGGNMI